MKRTLWIVEGVVLLVVVLAGAALAAGRLQGRTSGQEGVLGTQGLAGATVAMVDAGDGGMVGSVSAIEIKSAEEQPQSAPDAMGVFSRRDNNSIFVSSLGQGMVSGAQTIVVQAEGGAAPGDSQAKDVVVVTNDTAGDGGMAGSVSAIELRPAEEQPQSAPDAMGLFSRRDNNSIFVSSLEQGMVRGGQTIVVPAEGGAAPGDSRAKEVEAVVTNDTKVWEDVTLLSFGNEPPSGVTSIEQQLKPSSIDAIGQDSMVLAWGEKQGDRLIASVLIYSSLGQGMVSGGQGMVSGGQGMVSGGQAIVVQAEGGAAPGDSQAKEVEVVVTSDTKVWQDVTLLSFGNEPPSGVTSIEQELKPSSIDAIGQDSMVLAWGEKQGDRLIASVLIYGNPFAVISGQNR